MARALYNRDTLARIRGLTRAGDGVRAIASDLEWTASELRTVAARHSIPLIEDDPKGKPKAKVEAAPAAAAAPPQPAPLPAKRPKTSGGLLRKDCTGYVRDQSITLLVTRGACDAAAEIANEKGLKRGAIFAIALDHACRTGRLRALFEEAMAGRT